MNQPKNFLVCVTQQKTCERLIQKAAEMKGNGNIDLFVIHVAKNSSNFLDNDKEGEALEYLFGISKSVGANLTVLRSDIIVESIAEFATDHAIGCIILGQSPNGQAENKFSIELRSILPYLDIRIVPQVEI